MQGYTAVIIPCCGCQEDRIRLREVRSALRKGDRMPSKLGGGRKPAGLLQQRPRLQSPGWVEMSLWMLDFDHVGPSTRVSPLEWAQDS